MKLLKTAALALLLLPFGAVLAASAPPGAPAAPVVEEELDEVLVEGAKPTRNAQKVIDWLARLVGSYTYEGYVDLHGKGNPEDQLPVQGGANCIGFGPAPAVQCELKLSWPATRGPDGEAVLGGVSTLDPAMLLFGFEPDRIGIRYMLVDNKGIAEGALGFLVDDTLISKAPCVGIPDCQRVTRITADNDLKEVEMRIVLEVSNSKAASFKFVMRRVPGSAAVVVTGDSQGSR